MKKFRPLADLPKAPSIVPGARHVHLYDRVKPIPLDKLTSFFNMHLVAAIA